MQGIELVVKATVCLVIGGVNISSINSYPTSVERVLWRVTKAQ